MRKRGILLILIIVLSSSVFALVGDFDNDNEVGFSDFVLFSNAFKEYNENNEYDDVFDLDNDKEIRISDFFIFAENFGSRSGPALSSVAGDLDCNLIRDTKERDYCWDRQAVGNLNELECENIQDSQLKEFCKYRVKLFSGTLSKTLNIYHVDVERPSDMKLSNMLSNYNSQEFSFLEYEGVVDRDKKVVYSGKDEAVLFVIEAPEGQRFGSLSLSDYVYGYDTSDFGAVIGTGFTDENVFVRVSNGEYITLKKHRERTSDVFAKNAIPIVDGKISFIFNDFYNQVVIDQVFRSITFAVNEGDFGYLSRIWGRSELKPNGEFELI